MLCFYVGAIENGSQAKLLSRKPGCPGYSSVEPINHIVKFQPWLSSSSRLLLVIFFRF